MEKAKVLIFDQMDIFREGLAMLLRASPDIELVRTCTSAAEAVEEARASGINVIIINWNFLQDNIVEVIQYIYERLPGIGILILTASKKESNLMAAIKAGARGYVFKTITPDDLIKTITLVASGGVIISAPMAEKMVADIGSEPDKTGKSVVSHETLTEREKDVLQLVARGASNREIASDLFIAENTVRAHMRNIMEKWHVHSRPKAVAMAHKRGFDTGEEEAKQ